MKLKLVGLLAGLAVAGPVSEASAAIVDITYTGTLANAYDTGLFGPPSSLNGAGFTAHFSFDTSTTGTLYNIASPQNNGIGGGSAFGAYNSPAISASITILGITKSFGLPSVDGQIYANNDGTNSQQEDYAYSSYPDNGMYANVFSPTTAIPATIDVAFSYTLQPGDTYQGGFAISDGVNSASGFFDITSLSETVPAVGAVPEPSTWAMMVLGFFGLGLITFRRKNVALTAA